MAKYQVSINYEGNDYNVIVDNLEMAVTLTNDYEAAENFLRIQFPWIFQHSNHGAEDSVGVEVAAVSRDTGQDVVAEGNKFNIPEANDAPNNSHVNNISSSEDIIWSKKKPSDKDIEATYMLLSLRQKFQKEFDVKKTSKAKLWHKIAEHLKANKFNAGVNGTERCRQKFSNLTKTYLGYIKHQKTTGKEKNDDMPPFFEEINSIIGSKHKVKPEHLEDSLDSPDISEGNNDQESVDTDISNEGVSNPQNFSDLDNEPSTSGLSQAQLNNRFRNVKRKVRPISKGDRILKEIQEERTSREKQFDAFSQHLHRAEEQRERFLNILEKSFSTKRKSLRVNLLYNKTRLLP